MNAAGESTEDWSSDSSIIRYFYNPRIIYL